MSKILLTGGAGGALSDECTATLADIPSGLRAVALDSDDDIGVGMFGFNYIHGNKYSYSSFRVALAN